MRRLAHSQVVYSAAPNTRPRSFLERLHRLLWDAPVSARAPVRIGQLPRFAHVPDEASNWPPGKRASLKRSTNLVLSLQGPL